MRWLVVAYMAGACAPPIDGPAEEARAADVADGARLALQLHALPGAVAAHVVLHRPASDPFTRAEPPGTAAILVVVDDLADRAAIATATARLVHAAVPEIARPEIVVELGRHREPFATVGPFTVAAATKPRLVAALVAGLAMIALLSGYIAWRARVQVG